MRTIRTSGFWGKFGKKPARRDKRNFTFASLVARRPKLPVEYDFDEKYIAIPTPMFGNDYHGDCVIAGRAHQTLRFEYLEQRRVLGISTAQVLREWHRENGRTEDGLNVLDSLREWRSRGWKSDGGTYKIKAFAEVGRSNHTEVRQAIYMQVGIGLGLGLPYGALPQFNAGKIWDVQPGHAGKPDPDGGHYVYCPGYTKKGPVCVTWGRKQQMTWDFFDRYSDEAYTVVDAHDAAMKRAAGISGALDQNRLKALLEAVDP
jgi:hypothetical protein